MNYQDIIQTISEIVNNDDIYKTGLTLVYELDEKRHKEMDEHLYYKANPDGKNFKHNEVVEVEIGGIMIKFIKSGG